jgi:sec-independent protein translocase protein TatA
MIQQAGYRLKGGNMPFGLHWPEIVIILVIVLIIFGVGKLPQIGGAIGKSIKEFRKAKTEPDDGDKPTTDNTAQSSEPDNKGKS